MRRRKRIAHDPCGCGCGEPHRYPIGPTLAEATLMGVLLREYIRADHYGMAATAESLLAKVEHALPGASRGVR